MKTLLALVVCLMTLSSFAQSYGDQCKEGLKHPNPDKLRVCEEVNQEFALKCVRVWSNPTPDMIRECLGIGNSYSLSCIDSIETGGPDKIRSCSQISNPHAAGCVAHWKNATFDMIQACTSIESELSEACVEALKSGTPDKVRACARVKDNIGLECVRDLEVKSYDAINLCAVRSSLPNNHLDCYHCSQAEKETAMKVYQENADALGASMRANSERLQEILKDKKFQNESKYQELSLNCISESMEYSQIYLRYISNRLGVVNKEKIPGKHCTKLFKKYDEYTTGNSKEKSGLMDWFKK